MWSLPRQIHAFAPTRCNPTSACGHFRVTPARFSIDATSQLPLGFATNVLLDDGSWVAVGAIESTAVMCDVTSTIDANAATAVNGEQQIVLFVPGPETQDGFNCTLGGESELGFFFVSELRTGP